MNRGPQHVELRGSVVTALTATLVGGRLCLNESHLYVFEVRVPQHDARMHSYLNVLNVCRGRAA